MTGEHVERDLDAYVDRELDSEAAAAIRDHLRECAGCRHRVGDRELLGRFVRSTPYYAAPPALRARISTRSSRSGSLRRIMAWAAAAVLIISAGAGVALLRSRAARADSIVDEAVNGHVRSLMADHLFDVRSTDLHTVKPWFLGRLDFSPPVTDLAASGYPLVGGRLDYLGGQPVAALVYQRRQHTINVFVGPERAGTTAGPEAVSSVRGFHVHHWTRDGMSFWAVSDLNDVELAEFVAALRKS